MHCTLSDQKRHAEAEAAQRVAITLDPGQAIYHHHLGLALSGQGRRAEAEEAFREATRLDIGPSAGHTAAG